MATEIIDFNNDVGPVAMVSGSRFTFRTILTRIVNIERNGQDASEDRAIAEVFLEYYNEHGMTEIK